MIAALIGAGVLLAIAVGLPAVRRTGVLPVWRIRRAPVILPQHEAERARILATPVEELAEEIVRERERAAPGYLVDAQVTYARAIASFVANYGALREAPPIGERLALPPSPAVPAVVPRRETWCGPAAASCREHLFDAPNLRRSICGLCGRVVDWEAARA